MKYKVILADDEPIMRKALQTLIDWEKLDCEIVCVAENGYEVLEFLKENRADIMITDIKMPGADGIEILKYIWENKLHTKAILLTAYADFSYAQSAITYNVMEYVIKTGTFEHLVKAVEKCKKILKEKDFPALDVNKKSEESEFPVKIDTIDAKRKIVQESLAYIDEHYQEMISVTDISKALGTSNSYLSRIFKESMGQTIIHTINCKKIETAKMYLKKTDYKVYEVADMLGFENVTYFSKFFKKHTGMSPKEYKEK